MAATTAAAAGAACLEALAGVGGAVGAQPTFRLVRRLGVKLAFLEDCPEWGQGRAEPRAAGVFQAGAEARGGCLFADGCALRYGPEAARLADELCARQAHRAPLATATVLGAAAASDGSSARGEVARLLGELLLRGVLHLEKV